MSTSACTSLFISASLYSLSTSLCLSPSLSVSLSPSLYLSVCLCLCFSVCLSVCVSLRITFYLFVFFSLSASLCLSLFCLLSLSLCVSISLSLSASLSLYLCLYVCLSVSLSCPLHILSNLPHFNNNLCGTHNEDHYELNSEVGDQRLQRVILIMRIVIILWIVQTHHFLCVWASISLSFFVCLTLSLSLFLSLSLCLSVCLSLLFFAYSPLIYSLCVVTILINFPVLASFAYNSPEYRLRQTLAVQYRIYHMIIKIIISVMLIMRIVINLYSGHSLPFPQRSKVTFKFLLPAPPPGKIMLLCALSSVCNSLHLVLWSLPRTHS